MKDFKYSGEKMLFIGNSITVHGKCSYWWGEWGMAASEKENDYVHRLVAKINIPGGVSFECFNFFMWEAMAHDRSETLLLIDGLLSETLSRVVVQLGENVKDLTTLESDYEELLDYIAKKTPNSQIIMLDNVWNLPVSHEMKLNASKNKGVDFVDLSDLWDDESLLCGLGTNVNGEDEKWHIVEHKGVAGHPGDRYMEKIAERLFNRFK